MIQEALDRVEIIGNKIETQEAPDLIDQPSDSDAKAPSRAEVDWIISRIFPLSETDCSQPYANMHVYRLSPLAVEVLQG